MPEYAMVQSAMWFYYEGRNDFENLRQYLRQYTSSVPKLNTDGSVYYYSGSGMYSTLHPGEWLVWHSVPHSNEMVRAMSTPAASWPEDFPAGR